MSLQLFSINIMPIVNYLENIDCNVNTLHFSVDMIHLFKKELNEAILNY